MSEEQIELWVEKMVDRLDSWLMRGLISAEDYRVEMNKLHAEAQHMYSEEVPNKLK